MDALIVMHLVIAFLFGVVVGFVLDKYLLPAVVHRWVQWARSAPRNDL